MLNNYKEFIFHKGVTYGLNVVDLTNILINEHEMDISHMKLKTLNDEDADRIYNFINELIEEDMIKYLPFSGIFRAFIEKQQLNILNAKANIYNIFDLRLFLMILKEDSIFISNNNELIIIDQEFKSKFEERIIEFLCFIEELNKLIWVKKENNIQIPNQTKENLIDSNLDINDTNDNDSNNHNDKQTVLSKAIIRKPALKPYDKNEILLTEKCEVDYGNKKITKKDIRKREKLIANTINKANKILEKEIEYEIIKGNFIDGNKKVLFSIPHNNQMIFNHINASKN